MMKIAQLKMMERKISYTQKVRARKRVLAIRTFGRGRFLIIMMIILKKLRVMNEIRRLDRILNKRLACGLVKDL